MNSRIVAIFAFVVGALIIGYGIIQAVQLTRGGRSTTSSPPIVASPTPAPGPVNLNDYATNQDAEVKLVINGQIVAKEQHFAQDIAISSSHRSFGIIGNYSGVLGPSQGYDNVEPAFEDFMHALQYQGFTKTKAIPRRLPQPADTPLGLCPSGLRYEYYLISGGQTVYYNWSTSCNDTTTFAGNANTIVSLFKLQIPNYNTLYNTWTPAFVNAQ